MQFGKDFKFKLSKQNKIFIKADYQLSAEMSHFDGKYQKYKRVNWEDQMQNIHSAKNNLSHITHAVSEGQI